MPDPPVTTPAPPPTTVASLEGELKTLTERLQDDIALPGATVQRSEALARRVELVQQIDGLRNPAPPAPPEPAPLALPETLRGNDLAVGIAKDFQRTALQWGLIPSEAQRWVDFALTTPPGPPTDKAEALRAFKDQQEDAEAAYDLAWADLPRTVQVLLEQKGLAGHPRVVNFLVARGLQGDPGMTRLDAKEQYEALLVDRASPLNAPKNEAERAAALAEVYRLKKILYGVDFAPGHVRR